MRNKSEFKRKQKKSKREKRKRDYRDRRQKSGDNRRKLLIKQHHKLTSRKPLLLPRTPTLMCSRKSSNSI